MPTASSAAAPLRRGLSERSGMTRPARAGAYSAVKYIEMPWPPPMHMETMASRFSG